MPEKLSKKTRVIDVGGVLLGGGHPVRVQSMTNTDTSDIATTLAQIKHLVEAGCEIVRVSVPDDDALAALPAIVKGAGVPVVADIHFNHKLAIGSLQAGAACVRINPGNIGGTEKTLAVVKAAKDLGAAIRIGVNSGSLERDLLDKYGVSAEALAESASRYSELLESADFRNYKVSIKASNVAMSVAANELFSAKSDVPLHIGITEAGTKRMGIIKSAVGIGALLLKGIGDTIRVSLTADPVDEIGAGFAILNAAGLRQSGVEVISCPTCARTKIDIITLAEKVEDMCAKIPRRLKVAVMGCVVNGPGEAREADFGIAGGVGEGLLFAKGEILKKLPEARLLDELMVLIKGSC
ncbi:flavodoxin-dependent (E)-4-hydroxy-3-methylbut-2-enyl-diphosphate synthase [Deferribacterales bacterium RsTz2092]|nr:4-hydroxy-3-methylbut-2-en-1-yl diphosphate synthase (flavodoxin) [Deferribacterales bacterium]